MNLLLRNVDGSEKQEDNNNKTTTTISMTPQFKLENTIQITMNESDETRRCLPKDDQITTTKLPINSSDETPIDDTFSSSIPAPPDGGYGWVIVFASFMCNVIVDGVIFSFGILLLEMATEFKETRANTAWIGSLQTGCYLILGPIVSAFANKYGCRNCTIFGSILASIGFVLSFFATNIKVLYITYGIITGIGFGFIFLPAIVTVGFYFEKKRAFATGTAVCGSGIGAFVMAPLTQYLVDYYGWRGSLLIMAGVTLNCAVFGALFRPLEANQSASASNFSSNQEKPLLYRIKEARDAQWTESDLEDDLDAERDPDEEEVISPTDSQSSDPPSYGEVMGRFFVTNNSDTTQNEIIAGNHHQHQVQKKNQVRNQLEGKLYDCVSLEMENLKVPTMALKLCAGASEHTLQLVDPANLSNKIMSQSMIEKCDQVREMTFVASNITLTPQCQTSFNLSDITDMFDLTLLTSPSFIILSLSGFFTMAGFFIPFMYLVDRAVLLGSSLEKAALLLSIIGITNTVGRVFCGYISDHPRVNALLINNVALTIGGTATLLSPILCTTYASLIIYGAVFGISIACFAALRSVITVELLGIERLTSAFGLLLLFQGIACIVGSPLAGWFFDITGSYDNSFYLSGCLIAMSGIICFSLPCISRWEKARDQKKLDLEMELK